MPPEETETVQFEIRKPDDWHLHLRDAGLLNLIVPHSARRFGRAMVMPNLNPPITTVVDAVGYRDRILAAVPPGCVFDPWMTLFLTERLQPSEIHLAKASGVVRAVKWYPAGATTNSESGVQRIRRCFSVLAAMEECDFPLLVHAESPDPSVDIFDREAHFIEHELIPVIKRFPKLRLVVEHVTTRDGVEFVRDYSDRLGATITAHHLLLNRNAIFEGGIRPHYYCRPVLKRESHRLALIEIAMSGHPRFFLGTDSAPHPRREKESGCGCAGIYTAHAAIELYAEVFAQNDALHMLEGFANGNGAAFHGVERNHQKLVLLKQPQEIPETFGEEPTIIVPFRAGQTVAWRIDN